MGTAMHADDVDQSDLICKGDHTPFMQFYTSDWTAGTIGFTLEQRGFYLEALKTMWELKSGLPDDVKWLASALRCDPRTARRLRGFLLNKGKLVIRYSLLINPRMEKEIARWKRKLRANFGQRSGEDQPKLDLIFSKNPTDSTVVPFPPRDIRDQNSESREEDRSFRSRGDDVKKPATVHRYVSEEALDVVRKVAPSWDRQMLLRKFLDWPGSKNAIDMDKAFIGWVKKFTKGKAAS